MMSSITLDHSPDWFTAQGQPAPYAGTCAQKGPFVEIKRFFSEPWFGFCNFAETARL
jgi:hypothetical protein